MSVDRVWLVGATPPLSHPKVQKTALGTQRYLTWTTTDGIADAVAEAKADGYAVVGVELAQTAVPLARTRPTHGRRPRHGARGPRPQQARPTRSATTSPTSRSSARSPRSTWPRPQPSRSMTFAAASGPTEPFIAGFGTTGSSHASRSPEDGGDHIGLGLGVVVHVAPFLPRQLALARLVPSLDHRRTLRSQSRNSRYSADLVTAGAPHVHVHIPLRRTEHTVARLAHPQLDSRHPPTPGWNHLVVVDVGRPPPGCQRWVWPPIPAPKSNRCARSPRPSPLSQAECDLVRSQTASVHAGS